MAASLETASFATVNDTDVRPSVLDIDNETCLSDVPMVTSEMLIADTTASSRPTTSALNDVDSSNDTVLCFPHAALVVVVVDVVDVEDVALTSIELVVVVVVVETVDVVDVDVVDPVEDVVEDMDAVV